MTQAQTGATFWKGRLLRSAAVSAFALSALAGGVVLSSGEAKACNAPLTANGQMDDCSFTDVINGQTITFTDKITLMDPPVSNGTGQSSVVLELTGVLYPNGQVQADIDYNSGPLTGATDIVTYKLEKTGSVSPVWFDQASLSANIGFAGGSVLKQIYSDEAMTNLIGQLSTTTGVFQTGPISGMNSTIYVKDTITANADGTVDNVINDFRNVPGPLPILGAGAAFGFSRKLRSRIKAASNA
jgi:hypothetical protein